MNALAYYKNSVSHPVMNLSVAIYDDQKMRKDPRFIEQMKTFNHNRLMQMMQERPYQGAFS